MFKKSIITLGLAAAIIAPVALGLGGCGPKGGDNNSLKVNSKEVYAMSALTSANYLNNLNGELNRSALLDSIATRPSSVSLEEAKAVNSYLKMFDELFLNNGLNNEVISVPESDSYYGTYKTLLKMSVPTVDGGTTEFKMYYNEIETDTEVEVDEDDDELEVSTRLTGIMFLDGSEYQVTGEKEVEIEDGEKEVSIEFTTKSVANPQNYIVVKQEIENDELEYEYSIHEQGKLVSKTKVEFEMEDDELQLKLQFRNKEDGTMGKVKYLIKQKVGNNNEFKVSYSNDLIKDSFIVTITENGNVFTYSNGFIETLV